METEAELLKRRKKTIKRMEEAKLLPKLDTVQLYGSGGNFKEVGPPRGYGIPLRRKRSPGRRSTGSKTTLG
jgi:hypothetical protein